MADKLAKAVAQRLNTTTTVDADNESFNMSKAYSYNGDTEHHFGVYYKAERKEGDPNTVILWIDPFVKMAVSSTNGAATYIKPTNGEDVSVLPGTDTYTKGTFLRWNTSTSAFKKDGYQWLFGSCADNTDRIAGNYWTSIEVPLAPEDTVCYLDFFFTNRWGKGNGIPYCYNTKSYGARYNRMRFEFEIPAGYTNNGPITITSHTRNAANDGGTITWTQTMGKNNGINGYKFYTADGGWLSIGPMERSYPYTDEECGWQKKAAVDIHIESMSIQGDHSHAYWHERKWDYLFGTLNLNPRDTNGRLALNVPYHQTATSYAPNPEYKCKISCIYNEERYDQTLTPTNGGWDVSFPNELVGSVEQITIDMELKDGYETYAVRYFAKIGSKISLTQTEEILNGRGQVLNYNGNIQIDGQALGEAAPEFPITAVCTAYDGSNNVVTKVTQSFGSQEAITINIGSQVNPYLSVEKDHDLIITLQVSSTSFLSEPEVQVATLHIAASDGVTTSLGAADGGPWFATAEATDPKIIDTFITSFTQEEPIRYRYVKRSLGSQTWTNYLTSLETGTSEKRTWNIQNFDPDKTGEGFELALYIEPTNGAPAYYKPFVWNLAESPTAIARFLPKSLGAPSAWDPNPVTLVDDNEGIGGKTGCSSTYTNTNASAPKNAAWWFFTESSSPVMLEEDGTDMAVNYTLNVPYPFSKPDDNSKQITLTQTSGKNVSSALVLNPFEDMEGTSIIDYDISLQYACVVYNIAKQPILLESLVQSLDFKTLQINYGSKPYFDNAEINIQRGKQ